MWNNFFKHIDIDPANAHVLDGNAQDLEAECQQYEQKIAEAGGIELFVGGPGPGLNFDLASGWTWASMLTFVWMSLSRYWS